MKKLFVLFLTLCLCATSFAMAETPELQNVEIPVSFEATSFTIDSMAVGLQIPADFIKAEITDDQVALGMCLNATDAAQTYMLQVFLKQEAEEIFPDAFKEQLAATADIVSVQTILVNDMEFITYANTVTKEQSAVYFLNEVTMLTFTFSLNEGAQIGTVPLQIMGSLFDL